MRCNKTPYTPAPTHHPYIAPIAIAVAPKFSASHYWDDVRRYRATGVQYIGELCRCLLARPPVR